MKLNKRKASCSSSDSLAANGIIRRAFTCSDYALDKGVIPERSQGHSIQ